MLPIVRTLTGLLAFGATSLALGLAQAAVRSAAAPPVVAAPGPLVLYAFGDSTVSGVGARSGSYAKRLFSKLVEVGRGQRFVNLAESGATTVDVLEQLSRAKLGRNAIIVLGVGVNDLTDGIGPELFARRFEAILTTLRSRSSAPIIVSNLPDVSLASAVPSILRSSLAAQVDVYNAIIARLARQYSAAVYDVCAMTRESLPVHPEYLSSDGYHPSDLGYAVWAQGLWQILQGAL